MRLLFDHGTLVLAEAADLKLERVPGLLWDPRIALFRAPAWRYPEVLDALRHPCRRCATRSRPRALPKPAAWNAVELRPYQRAALLSWELSGRRGTVVLPTGSGKTQVAIAALRAAGSTSAVPGSDARPARTMDLRSSAPPIEAQSAAWEMGGAIWRRSRFRRSRVRTG